jgi:ABC-2 family transporter protein
MGVSLTTLVLGTVLLLVQALLALPWLYLALATPDAAQFGKEIGGAMISVRRVLIRVLILGGAALVGGGSFAGLVHDTASLEIAGRFYAAIFQLQVTINLFIGLFLLMLLVWPKAGAVALAAFREGVRQWMFWLLVTFAVLMMTISIFVPYFTFGEDYLMVKQIGYDTIMFFAILFGTLAASISISEEIEGRTAVTLMSKPVSRRQFLLGKYAGILLAALFMFGVLAVYFEGILFVKHWWDKLNPLTPSATETATSSEPYRVGVVATPAWVLDTLQAWHLDSTATDFLRGVGQWIAHSIDTLPGLILCFSHVLVLVALAVALATRVPMVVNLVTILVVYFAAHLTPALLSVANRVATNNQNSAAGLVGFVTRVFDTILPDLSSFRMDPSLLSDAPPPPAAFAAYVASVTFYGVLYTVIVLLLGLVLFEDKDLA